MKNKFRHSSRKEAFCKIKQKRRYPWEALLFLTPSVAFATNYQVSDTTSLTNAINSINSGSGGDTITLAGNITLSSLLPAISKSVTIQGQGYSISGNNTNRIFTVTGGQLSVINAALINGKALGATGGTGGSNPLTGGTGPGGGGGAGYSNGVVSNGSAGGNSTNNGTTAPSGGAGGTNGGAGGSTSNGSSASSFGAGGGGAAGGSSYSSNGTVGGIYYDNYYGGSGGFGGGYGGNGGGAAYEYKNNNFEYSWGGGGGGGGGSAGVGGAILVQGGSVSLQNVSLSGNSAVGGNGGAGGSTSGYGNGGSGGSGGSGLGGAIFVNSGTALSITDGSLSSNSASGGAGGAGGTSADEYGGYSGGTGSASGQDAYLYGGTLNYTVNSGAITAQVASTSVKSTLTKTGTGTLSLTAPGTNYFNLNLNGGTVSLGSSGAVSTGGSTISFGGGTLQFTGFNINDYSGEFSAAANQLYSLDTNGYLVTLASGLTSSGGSLTKIGSGTLLLTGANTYNGGTTISGGTLQVGNGGTSGTIGTGAIVDNGGLTFDLSSNTNLGVAISGSGSLLAEGGGNLTLSGTNTYAGGTTISGGTVTVQGTTSINHTSQGMTVGASTAGTSTLMISNGGQVSDSYGYVGGYTASGSGTVTVTDVNANGTASAWKNSGTVIVGYEGLGTLNVQNGGQVSDSYGYLGYLSGGAATVTGVNANGTASNWTNTTGIYLGYDSSGSLTISNGAIVKSSFVDMAVTGPAGGTLNVNSGGVLQTGYITTGTGTGGAAINLNGGILRSAGYYSSFVSGLTAGNFTLLSGGGTIDNNGNYIIISSPIGGIGALTSTGAGVLSLTGSNTYSGGTNLNGGELSLGSAGAIGTTGTISFAGGTLQFTSYNTTDYSSRFNTSSGQLYSFDTNGQTVTFSSNLDSSGGSLTKLGAGTLILTGSNTYTGATNINGGTLAYGAGMQSLSNLSFNNSGTLEALNGSTVQLTGSPAQINGAAFTTVGSGQIVNPGNLSLNNVTNSGSFVATNGSSTTLSGSIVNSGNITLNSAGNVTALVVSGTATLSGGGTVKLNGGLLAGNVSFSYTPIYPLLDNVDNTIEGSGVNTNPYSGSSFNLTNETSGVINANVSGQILEIDAQTVQNSGTLEATNGGTLQLGTSLNYNSNLNSIGGTIQALRNSTIKLGSSTYITGANILAQDGATVELVNGFSGYPGFASVTNSTLQTTGSGQIINSGSTYLYGVTNSGTFLGADGSSTTLSGSIVNSGNIAINSTGDITTLVVSGTATLSGGGAVKINGGLLAGYVPTSYNPNFTLPLLDNVDNTIEGSGVNTNPYSGSSFNLTNETGGVVNANVSGQILEIDAQTLQNSGTLEATNGGTLQLGTSLNHNSNLNSIGGTIQALSNSTVELGSNTFITGATILAQDGATVELVTGFSGYPGVASVTSSTLRTVGSGQIINSGNAYLSGVTNSGSLVAIDGSSTSLSGSIFNSGNIAISSTGDVTTLVVNSNTTLSGGGAVKLNGALLAGYVPTSYNPNFTTPVLDNVNNTIEGSGINTTSFSPNTFNFTNETNGVVNANVSGQALEIDAQILQNSGMMEATNGGTLQLGSHNNFSNVNSLGGKIQALTGSTIELNGNLVVSGGAINLDGGTLRAMADSTNFVVGSSSNGFTLGSNGGTIDSNGYDITVGTIISGAGELTKTGLGTLNLTANNTYSGGTQIDAGLVLLTGSGSLGTGGVNFGGGMLQYANGVTTDISGLIKNSSQAIVVNTNGNTLTTYAHGLDSSNTGGLNKSGGGTLALSGTNTYTGGTTVSGGKLAVEGSVVGNVTIQSGAEVGGHGSIGGTIGGSGSVGPGDSPGILTASATDPSGGLAYNFEFTQPGSPTWNNAASSGNDVLHLTAALPFSAPLTSANDINMYFSQLSFTYEGGFFTNGSTDDLSANIANAKYNYYLLDNTNGTILYNGNKYDVITGQIIQSTQQITAANFGDGTVNGWTMQFSEVASVPEPSTWALLLGGVGLLVFSHRRTRPNEV